MLKNDLKDILQKSFHDKFDLVERKENLYQLIVPLYHEDGDMMDIFIQSAGDSLIVCDCGMTLMRLSYTIDVSSPHREKILLEILTESGAKFEDGNILIHTEPDMLFKNIMQLSQVISKVSSMKMLRQRNISSMFYENVQDYVFSSLSKYNPQKDYLPIEKHDEYMVDYFLTVNNRPYYLFAIKGEEKALVSIVSVMAFLQAGLTFTSLAVPDDMDNLTKKTRSRMTNVMDKAFYKYNDFTEYSTSFFERFAS